MLSIRNSGKYMDTVSQKTRKVFYDMARKERLTVEELLIKLMEKYNDEQKRMV